MELIFKMDFVWWIDIFVGYVLPVFGVIISTCLTVLFISFMSERRRVSYERPRKN